MTRQLPRDNFYVCTIKDGIQYCRFGCVLKPLTEQLKAGNTPDLLPYWQAKLYTGATVHEWRGNPYLPTESEATE